MDRVTRSIKLEMAFSATVFLLFVFAIGRYQCHPARHARDHHRGRETERIIGI